MASAVQGSESAYAFWAGASLFFSAIFLFLYAWFPMTRRAPSQIIFWVVVSEAMLALSFLLDQGGSNCNGVVFIAQFFEFSSQAWRFLVFVDIVMIVRNPYEPARHWKKYQLVVWPLALTLSLLTERYAELEKISGFCITFPTQLAEDSTQWLLMYSSSVVFAVAAVLLVVYVQRLLRKPEYRLLRKRRLIQHGYFWVGVFFCMWLLVYLLYGLFRILESAGTDDTEDVFSYLFPPLISGRGAIIVLLWVYKNDVARRIWYRSHARSDNDADKPLESDYHMAQNEVDFIAQIRLLLMYTTAACIRTRDGSKHVEINAAAAEDVQVALGTVEPKADDTNDRSELGGSDGDRSLAGKELEATVRAGATSAGRMVLTRKDQPLGVCWDYGLEQFRSIREACGISEAAYSNAFLSEAEIDSLVEDDFRTSVNGQATAVTSFKEVLSEGASGSYFYFTHDGAYIVKTISEHEYLVMMAILDEYRDYVLERAGETMIRYYGCHATQLPMSEGKIFFVVMKNCLPLHMTYKFDLKGATFKRHALSSLQMQRELAGGATCTLLEAEWMDAMMHVDITPADRARLDDTVGGDLGFLAQQGLVDYSLLLGIHSPEDPEQALSVEEYRGMGGYPSSANKQVFFFGMVDILEMWNRGWCCQGCCLKGVFWIGCHCHLMHGITAINPWDYSNRFSYFVKNFVLSTRELSTGDEPVTEAGSVDERWAGLWNTVRNGLMMRRIQDERQQWRHVSEQLDQANETIALLNKRMAVQENNRFAALTASAASSAQNSSTAK